MSEQIDQISELGGKRNDKWGQLQEYREKLAKDTEEKAATQAASQSGQIGQTAPTQNIAKVQAKGDVAGLSAEALSNNQNLSSKVNFGAWDMGEPSGTTKEGRPIAEVQDTAATKNPKRAAGEAVASEAASGAGAQTAQAGSGAGGIQLPEASGTATGNKPQTVPGVGGTQASKRSS